MQQQQRRPPPHLTACPWRCSLLASISPASRRACDATCERHMRGARVMPSCEMLMHPSPERLARLALLELRCDGLDARHVMPVMSAGDARERPRRHRRRRAPERHMCPRASALTRTLALGGLCVEGKDSSSARHAHAPWLIAFAPKPRGEPSCCPNNNLFKSHPRRRCQERAPRVKHQMATRYRNRYSLRWLLQSVRRCCTFASDLAPVLPLGPRPRQPLTPHPPTPLSSL